MKKILVLAVMLSGALCKADDLPEIYFGKHKNGCVAALSFNKSFPDSICLFDKAGQLSVDYSIEGGTIRVNNNESIGHILNNGQLGQDARELMESATAGIITIQLNIRNNLTNISSQVESTILLGIRPEVYYGEYRMGSEIKYEDWSIMTAIAFGSPAHPELNSFFSITSGILIVDGMHGEGTINEKGELDAAALHLLKNSAGRVVTIILTYSEGCGISKKGGISFTCGMQP